MDQKIINLYDSFTHSEIIRKDFMKKLASIGRVAPIGE